MTKNVAAWTMYIHNPTGAYYCADVTWGPDPGSTHTQVYMVSPEKTTSEYLGYWDTVYVDIRHTYAYPAGYHDASYSC
ncbi:hypothetical protein [Allobranchiibius huperziae]|uniref:Uncharacterized protein n=1 Tax=Allobranchiibius huperziae TaxID=1874116 RepID=A0A853DDV7_9MICO|nr:hypothetical protein [Allobranchiibius huperziae]NYJ73121.1 hypothetical protein [Allobranchiibius huperziae]